MIFRVRRQLLFVFSCVTISIAPPAHLAAQATVAAPVQPVVPGREIVREFVRRDPGWSCGQMAGVQYTASVRVNIDAEGRPSGAQVEQSSGRDCLDQLAVAAVNGAAFTAATAEDGKPLASTIVVPVKFPFHGLPSPGQIAAQPHVSFAPEVSVGRCSLPTSMDAVISLTVNVDGLPSDVKLERSSGSTCLDKQALQLGEQYRFKPAVRDGQAVATTIHIDVNFQKF
jgi:TonB family protein